MEKKIKSGVEILDDFFANLSNDESLNQDIVKEIQVLYKDGKFTQKSLTNALSDLRSKANG